MSGASRWLDALAPDGPCATASPAAAPTAAIAVPMSAMDFFFVMSSPSGWAGRGAAGSAAAGSPSSVARLRELALRVVEPAERIRLVGEGLEQRDVVLVDAVAEREGMADQGAAHGPLADVDHVVLEPAAVRVAGQVAAEHAEALALAHVGGRLDRQVEPQLVGQLGAGVVEL